MARRQPNKLFDDAVEERVRRRATVTGIQRVEFFLAAGTTNLGLTKMRSTQAHSGLWCPELAQLRPQIVPWSTLCRADSVRNDLVLTMRG
jgi:hypothetical protein